MKKNNANNTNSIEKSKLSLLDIAKKLEDRNLFTEKKTRGIKALSSLNPQK